MFARENRYSFKRGIPKNVYRAPFFVLRFQKNNDTLHCAVITGKKIDKRAVVRNRLRRQFTQNLKNEIGDKTVSYDLVFYLRKDILGLENKIMQAEIKKTLETLIKK